MSLRKFPSGIYSQQSAGDSDNGLAENLVALWDFDETSGTKAYDSKRHNDLQHTGTAVNQTGILDKCVQFSTNDSTDSVRSDLPDYWFNFKTQSYSIAFWYKTTDPDPANVNPYPLYYRRGLIGDGYPFALVMGGATNIFQFFVYDGSTTVIKNDVSVNTDGNWHHIVFVVDSSAQEIRMYHDGSEAGSAFSISALSNIPTYQAQDLQMGYSVVSRTFSADVDQLAIWKEALSTTKISALYNSGNGLASSAWTGGPTCPTVSGSQPTQCNHSSSITGTCTSPTYQWQYFESIPCGCWKDIVGATSSTYDNSSNGYSLVRLRVKCETEDCWIDSGSITENCPCLLTVTASETSCVVSYSTSLGTCSSPSHQWQRDSGGGVFVDITGETGSTYTSTDDETVRLKLTCVGAVSGTCIFYSNSVSVTCAPGGACKMWSASSQQNNSSTACSQTLFPTTIYINQAGSIPAVNDTTWTDSGCSSTSFSGGNRWYKIDDGGGTTYAARINAGVITSIVTC